MTSPFSFISFDPRIDGNSYSRSIGASARVPCAVTGASTGPPSKATRSSFESLHCRSDVFTFPSPAMSMWVSGCGYCNDLLAFKANPTPKPPPHIYHNPLQLTLANAGCSITPPNAFPYPSRPAAGGKSLPHIIRLAPNAFLAISKRGGMSSNLNSGDRRAGRLQISPRPGTLMLVFSRSA